MSRLPACLALALAMALTAAPALATSPYPHAQRVVTAGEAVPDLMLQTANGPLPMSALDGRWTWVYMGYANCPDVCPTTMSWLAQEYRRLANPSHVRVLFVSVDPLRDTPDRLATYAHYFHPDFVGATGSRGAIDGLAAALGVRYEIPKDARADKPYPVGHTNAVALLDPKGKLVAVYNPDGDGLAEDFAALDAPIPTAAPAAPKAGDKPFVYWCDANSTDWLMQRARSRGSGTSLIPAASPMRMHALAVGDWRWMFDYHADLGYNDQGGPRGSLTWAAENWQMAMGSGPVGPGILDLNLMTSLEPFTLPAGGTPQLLQEGETYRFNPLIDAQHPHDLLMELTARYTWRLADNTDFFLYGGPVGEPALGPTAFMHRPSAADNPWAPLAHHHQDATHITEGVVTAGTKKGPWQLEGSYFNGREPDEYRTDVEAFQSWNNSFSGRLSYMPDSHWAMQVSTGRLHNPERLHPGDIQRTTASILTVQDTPVGPWSTQLVWGQNLEEHPPVTEWLPLQSYGLESQLDAWLTWHFYGRFEVLDQDGLPPDVPLNHTVQRIEAITAGVVHDLGVWDKLNLGIGADATAYGLTPSLQAAYGYNPVSFRVYLRLEPPAMEHGPTVVDMPMK